MSIKGQKLFIIGGSSGIGKATALEAIEQGAHVIIAGRTEDRLANAQSEIGGRVEYVVLDVRETREMDYCFEQSGGFDHLVVTAAESYEADFVETDLDEARKAFETKFWGQFIAVQRSIPFLKKGGSVTLFSGSSGHRFQRGKAVLAAADGAVEYLVRTLAVELSPTRINAVSPGDFLPDDAEESERKSLADTLPVHRAGRAADIAHAVLFLIQNQYTTGTVLSVDGGRVLV